MNKGRSDDGKPGYFDDLVSLICDREASLEGKMERVIEVGRKRLGVDFGSVVRTEEGRHETVETNQSSGRYTAGSVNPIDKTWCRHVVAGERMVAVGDATETEYSDDPVVEESGLVCYIGAPIFVDGEVYGTLCYMDQESHSDFTEEERGFVKTLAQWMSYEIEREEYQKRLRRQRDRLDEFTGIVAHDLRNPLAAAVACVETALEEENGDGDVFLEDASDSLDRMEELIHELLSLAREGTDIGETEPVALRDVAEEAWRGVSTRRASIDIETEGRVMADRGRLRQLFENLFRNSVEHCRSDVSVRVYDIDGGFAVEDNGPGLPEGVRDGFFSSEAGSPETGEDGLMGLGLSIVETVTIAHGWEGSVKSDGSGTSFRFTDVEEVDGDG